MDRHQVPGDPSTDGKLRPPGCPEKIATGYGLNDKARFGHEPILVSKRKTPWAVILGVEDYEDLLNQLETMAEQLGPEFQKSLRQSMEEYRTGKMEEGR